MRHETALRLLDGLDAGGVPGLALRLHLSRCASCSRQAELLLSALRAYRSPEPCGDASRASTLEERVMAAIRLTPPPRQDFAVRDWAFPAAAMLISICLVVVGTDLGYLESLVGSGSAVYLSLVLGLAFTGYSALFVGSHLGELRAFLQKSGLMPR